MRPNPSGKVSHVILFSPILKGECLEIFYSGFFIKQLFLVPLDMHRKYFELFGIFEALIVFVIDFSVYSPPWSRDSPVYSSLGSQDSLVMNTPGT